MKNIKQVKVKTKKVKLRFKTKEGKEVLINATKTVEVSKDSEEKTN